MMFTENALPLWRWQCSQWQTAVAMGSPANSKVTDPHKQCPVVMRREYCSFSTVVTVGEWQKHDTSLELATTGAELRT